MSPEERLAETLELLHSLPILAAASAEEPWCKLRMVDLTKIIEVAEGATKKADWVHEPCRNVVQFAHSPHHWSDYQDGRDPLRTTHYCNGESNADVG